MFILTNETALSTPTLSLHSTDDARSIFWKYNSKHIVAFFYVIIKYLLINKNNKFLY